MELSSSRHFICISLHYYYYYYYYYFIYLFIYLLFLSFVRFPRSFGASVIEKFLPKRGKNLVKNALMPLSRFGI
ncbi:hypothetical protein ACMBCN_03240, partial [Candidatus Liberibacter asiaticus]